MAVANYCARGNSVVVDFAYLPCLHANRRISARWLVHEESSVALGLSLWPVRNRSRDGAGSSAADWRRRAWASSTRRLTTRDAFKLVLDSEKRPITVGGFVKTGPAIFKDVAEEAGLTTWPHTIVVIRNACGSRQARRGAEDSQETPTRAGVKFGATIG